MPSNGSMPSNAPAEPIPTVCDAHGKAALLLAESLVHGLCEKMFLSANDAVEIVDRAVCVQHERAAECEDANASPWRSHALLSEIANSLRADLKSEPPTPKPAP